jgi:hypothetical protein
MNEGGEPMKQPNTAVGNWRDWMVPPLLVPVFLAAAAVLYGFLRS